MDLYRKLVETLKQAVGGNNLPILQGKVVSIEGETCTVDVGGLSLPDVRLKAAVNNSSDYLILRPKIGSVVLIGSLSGDLKSLCVLKVDELAKVEYKQAGLEIVIDSQTGKVSVKNHMVSMKGLFDALFDVIMNLKVNTAVGPSVGLLPDSVAQLQAYKQQVAQLLN